MKKIIIICSIIWCMIIGAGVFYFVKSNPNEEKITYSKDLYYSVPDSKMIVKNPDTGGRYVKNELVFEAKENISYKEIEKLLKKYNGKIAGYIELTNTYQVMFEKNISYQNLCEVQKKLESDSKIQHISLNHVLPCSSQSGVSYPNDKLWKNEWSATPEGCNWGFEALQIPEAWQLLKDNQNKVNIGILEVNGIDTEHKDLKNNIETGHKYGNLEHGTEVSGIIGAEHNNGIGITGIVPNVRLSAVSFLQTEEKLNSQSGKEPVLMTYKVALTYLIAMQKCKVINMSLGTPEQIFAASHGNQDAITDSELCNNELGNYLKILLDNGYDFLICKGAGNLNDGHQRFFRADDNDPNAIFGYIEIKKENKKFLKKYQNAKDYKEREEYGNCDAKFDLFSGITDNEVKKHILVIGSAEQTETDYKVAVHTCTGERVDIIAPGMKIMTLEPGNHYTSKNKYVWGTSFATPYVSGVAGLVYMAKPTLKAEEVKEILCNTAKGEYTAFLNEKEYTYKLVNALDAVKTALGNNISEEKTDIELTQYLGQNIHDTIKNFDNMKDNHITSGGIGYTNDIITFESQKTDVTFMKISGEAPYTIANISYGTENDKAVQILTEQGWKLKESTGTYWNFVKENGDRIALHSQNKKQITMISYFVSEEPQQKVSIEKSDKEIQQMLVEHYQISDPEATVMDGFAENGIYYVNVRTGVPGNATASQRLYDVQVNLSSGVVTEWNTIINETTTWQLY